MKKFLLASVAAFIFAVPAMAADVVKTAPKPLPVVVQRGPQVQAWVGADAGWYNASEGGTSVSGYTLSASGAANVPMGAFNLEIEARGTDANVSGSGTGDLGVGAGYLHAFWRSPGAAFGGFLGFEDDAVLGLRIAGIEGQLYRGNFNLYGQLAGMGTSTSVPGISSAWFGRVGLTWFLNPNFLIGADYRYVTVNGSGFSATSNLFEVNAEWRGAGNPWALYVNASSQQGSVSGGGPSATLNRVVGGMRIHVGNGSLQEQYTTGASMNVLPSAF